MEAKEYNMNLSVIWTELDEKTETVTLRCTRGPWDSEKTKYNVSFKLTTDLMNMLADDVSAVMNNRIDNALDHKETMVSKLRDGTMRSGWELE